MYVSKIVLQNISETFFVTQNTVQKLHRNWKVCSKNKAQKKKLFFPNNDSNVVRETSEKRGAPFLRWEKPETGTGKSFLFMLHFFFTLLRFYMYTMECVSCSTKASLYGKLDFIYFPSRLSLIIWIKVWEKNQQYFHKRP